MLPTRRNVLTLALTGSALAGCGFQPVYMPTTSGKPGVAERHFSSDGGQPHRYGLGVSFWIAGEAVGIQTDNTATRIRLTGIANWTLTSLDPSRTKLTSGSARSLDGYNMFDQQYFAATMENEQVQKRIAEALADQVTLQLATWFRKPATPATG